MGMVCLLFYFWCYSDYFFDSFVGEVFFVYFIDKEVKCCVLFYSRWGGWDWILGYFDFEVFI